MTYMTDRMVYWSQWDPHITMIFCSCQDNKVYAKWLNSQVKIIENSFVTANLKGKTIQNYLLLPLFIIGRLATMIIWSFWLYGIVKLEIIEKLLTLEHLIKTHLNENLSCNLTHRWTSSILTYIALAAY